MASIPGIPTNNSPIAQCKMKIGIIDTGIDAGHKRFKDVQIDGFTLCKTISGNIVQQTSFHDEAGHGSGIASIILQHYPQAHIFIIKLKAESGKITEDLLTEAISLLSGQPGVKLINISLGIKTNTPSQSFKKVCDDAAEKGIIINAAAYYLANQLCFPAHFKSVFGVGEGVVRTKSEFSFNENGFVKVLAKGGLQRVVFPNNQYRFSTGTSLATAHFTGIIAKAYIEGNWHDKPSLINWLHKSSSQNVFCLTGHNNMAETNAVSKQKESFAIEQVYNKLRPWAGIQNVALFPVEEKEMISILENQQLFSYNLSLAIGYPRLIKVGKSATLLKEKNIPFINRPLTEDDFNSFDSIIVGYFLDKASDHNVYYGLALLKECIKRNKHFIVWDQTVYNLINAMIKEAGNLYTGEVYLTGFDQTCMNLLNDSLEYTKLTVPSICILGTNSRQGKFTTQIIIKRILEQQGYCVGHLATEPQGIVLGADFTFPIGHRGTVSIDIREWNKAIHLLTQLIEVHKKPDIIISGSQGGIFPLHPVDNGEAPDKLCFVKAFYPDAIICSIGPTDSIEFIQRTIGTIKGFVNTTVLFYVLTPWKYEFHYSQLSVVSFKQLSAEEYEIKRAWYQKELNAPVVNIMDSECYPMLLDIIQKKFSKN